MATLHIILTFFLLVLNGIDAAMAVECPDGFSPHGLNCYLFVDQRFSWFESQIACWSMGARLVEIETAEENSFVAGLMRSHHAQFAWLGMTDFAEEGVFMLTSQHVRAEYTDWRQGEPNDPGTGPGEDCVFMAADGQWLDAECHNYRKAFVCEIPNGEMTGPDLIG